MAAHAWLLPFAGNTPQVYLNDAEGSRIWRNRKGANLVSDVHVYAGEDYSALLAWYQSYVQAPTTKTILISGPQKAAPRGGGLEDSISVELFKEHNTSFWISGPSGVQGVLLLAAELARAAAATCEHGGKP